jgi:hypothetical protein
MSPYALGVDNLDDHGGLPKTKIEAAAYIGESL